jgi:hypothetical protein
MPREYGMTIRNPTDAAYQRMYELLKRHFPHEVRRPQDMAKWLGKSPVTVRNKKNQQKIDDEYVYHVEAKTGAREAYIRHGEEPVYKADAPLTAWDPEVQALLHIWRAMSALQRRLWLWVAALMARHEDDLGRWCEAHQGTPGADPPDTMLPPGYLIAASPSAAEEGRRCAPLDDPDEFP